MLLDTGIRVSGGHRLMQLKCRCGDSFTRQARRLKKVNLCRRCLKAQIPRIWNWSTAKLKSALENADNTDEYLNIIDDIKVVLWERENKKIELFYCQCIEE
jgi:hypothetical protein